MEALAARSSLAGCRLSLSATTKASAPQRVALTVESKTLTRTERNRARHKAIRNKIKGTTERPRLAVFRSNNHIHAQVIDDSAGHTLAALSTVNPALREELASGANKEAAEAVGKKLASMCLERGIDTVVFDRGGFQYHGRVKALAEAAREGGLVF
eukprot:CAMPEP_0118932314 /NCGR_PEP_ID=MMETSP1169-20130426/9837_1 /TAXON_ID=36882 /ORGANISM="Pyramimonas obovata, Strain CCMP722" /LENGTH=155 /DNA_ID=CAMNT_0006874953 /DNA_START=54 /DNA_END=521 /DNA_ORIENTATION=+